MEKQIKAKLEKIESLMENLLATFVSTSEKPLDLAEPAAYLSLSKSHLYHLTSEGLIPHYKPNGKKIYFLKSDLDSYLLRNRRAGAAEIETATQSHIAGSKTTVVGRVR